jgi:hypothetical protein
MKLKSMSFIDATEIKGLYDTKVIDGNIIQSPSGLALAVGFSYGDARYTLVTLSDLRDEYENEDFEMFNSINDLIAEFGEETLVRFIG